MTQFFDAVKAFEDDLSSKVAIPINNKNPPVSGASMLVSLNNTLADGKFLNSPARVMTGQFNIQISSQIGDSKYTMMSQANKILEIYKRGYSLDVQGKRMVVVQVNTSTPYPTEAHQNINVIIDFQFAA